MGNRPQANPRFSAAKSTRMNGTPGRVKANRRELQAYEEQWITTEENQPKQPIKESQSISHGKILFMQTTLISSKWLLLAGMAAALTFLNQASSQQPNGVVQHQYEGNLGQNRIGMTVSREVNKIEGGHYFYQKFLRDIPITGSIEGSHVTLT